MTTRMPLVALSLAALLGGPSPADEGGDPLAIEYTVPFEAALERARAEGKLLFVKPIYGGVDRAGSTDYRCGSW